MPWEVGDWLGHAGSLQAHLEGADLPSKRVVAF